MKGYIFPGKNYRHKLTRTKLTQILVVHHQITELQRISRCTWPCDSRLNSKDDYRWTCQIWSVNQCALGWPNIYNLNVLAGSKDPRRPHAGATAPCLIVCNTCCVSISTLITTEQLRTRGPKKRMWSCMVEQEWKAEEGGLKLFGGGWLWKWNSSPILIAGYAALLNKPDKDSFTHILWNFNNWKIFYYFLYYHYHI